MISARLQNDPELTVTPQRAQTDFTVTLRPYNDMNVTYFKMVNSNLKWLLEGEISLALSSAL